MEAQGAPNDLSKSGIDFASLLTADDKVDEENDGDSTFTATNRSRTNSRSSLKSSRSLSSDSENASADERNANGKSADPLQQMEASSKGQVKGSVSGTYFRSGANIFVLFIIFILFGLTQMLASGADYWVSFW